jgi:hypothetical protein
MLTYNSFKNKSVADKYHTCRKLMITTHIDDGVYIIKKLNRRYTQSGDVFGDKCYLMIDKNHFNNDTSYNFPITTGLKNDDKHFIYRTNNLEAAIEIATLLWDESFYNHYQVVNRTNGQIEFKTPKFSKDLDLELRLTKTKDVLKDSQNI